MSGERKLGAAERREFQIMALGAFIDTAKHWCGDDGEIVPQMQASARGWWLGAYEVAMIGPCKPSFITPSWMAIANHHPQLMTYCRNTLAALKAERNAR